MVCHKCRYVNNHVSAHLPGFQSFFRVFASFSGFLHHFSGFLHHFSLAKLANSSIKVKGTVGWTSGVDETAWLTYMHRTSINTTKGSRILRGSTICFTVELLAIFQHHLFQTKMRTYSKGHQGVSHLIKK